MRTIQIADLLPLLLLVGLGLSSLPACKRGQPASPEALEGESALSPDATPEEVVRLYQSYLDRDMYEEAKTISTESEQAKLMEVMKIIQEEIPDSSRLTSAFLRINCSIQGESAQCACKIRDQDDTYDRIFYLKRVNSRWLIDADPEDEELYFDQEVVREAMDSILKRK